MSDKPTFRFLKTSSSESPASDETPQAIHDFVEKLNELYADGYTFYAETYTVAAISRGTKKLTTVSAILGITDEPPAKTTTRKKKSTPKKDTKKEEPDPPAEDNDGDGS